MSNGVTPVTPNHNKRNGEYSRFVADIGGTHARFALVDSSTVSERNALVEIKVFKCADFAEPAETFIAYQNYLGHSLPDRACVAAAGPVSEGEVRFTNLDWRISAKDLRQELKLKSLEIVNDFTAVAHAVSKVAAEDTRVIHASHSLPRGRKVVVGAGTGLGVAALARVNGETHIIDSEGGHARFAPAGNKQRELLKVLSRKHDFVSMEMLLAGPGFRRIHKALATINGIDVQPMGAEEITSHARNNSNSHCVETVELYLQILAAFCSNLALNFGARGGIYMVGDVLRSIETLIATNQFRDQYLKAGCMSGFVEQTPLSLVLVKDPGLHGAAVCTID